MDLIVLQLVMCQRGPQKGEDTITEAFHVGQGSNLMYITTFQGAWALLLGLSPASPQVWSFWGNNRALKRSEQRIKLLLSGLVTYS